MQIKVKFIQLFYCQKFYNFAEYYLYHFFMAARVCSECGGLVASSLSMCPHCGYAIGRSDGVQDEYNSNYSQANNYARPENYGLNPHNNILWPVIALVFFWPCAIGSLIYYIKSDQAWNVGNAALARSYGESSAKWGHASIWIVIIILIFTIACFACVGSCMYDY